MKTIKLEHPSGAARGLRAPPEKKRKNERKKKEKRKKGKKERMREKSKEVRVKGYKQCQTDISAICEKWRTGIPPDPVNSSELYR